MSIIADIKKARAEYFDHLATHKCRDAVSSRADNQEPCAVRADLIQAWSGTASLWGQEHDDDARQRAHYERNLRPAAAL